MLKQACIMGIVNINEDSFYTASCCLDPMKALERIELFFHQGADIVDIGAVSSKPFAQPVCLEQELARITPLLPLLQGKAFSIDTTQPLVAEKAVQAGACMINDIDGFKNPHMLDVARHCDAKLIVMHAIGTTDNRHVSNYPLGIIETLKTWFLQTLDSLEKAGIALERCIIDPGIGFGKSVEDNLTIIAHLEELTQIAPVLLGISRKSFMKKILHVNTTDLLPATLVLNTIAVTKAVSYIRVHDVQEHVQLATLLQHLLHENSSF